MTRRQRARAVTASPPQTRRRWLPLIGVEAATVMSGTANGITNVVLPWLVLERTGSAAAAGLVAAATALPLLLSSLVAGTIVDRIGRRRASIISDVLSALAVAAIPFIDSFTDLSLIWIVALAALGAVFDPAGVTARESMLPAAAIAARIRLERMNGVHEAMWGLSFVIGPGVGGVLIGVIGPENALWATAAAFVASALVMVLVRVPESGRPARVPRSRRTSWLADTREGLLHVWRDKLLLSVALYGTVLTGTYLPVEGVLLPVYFQEQDHPERLGFLLLVMSVGWIGGSLLYGAIGHRLPRRVTFITASIGTTVALIPMVFLPPYPVLLAAGAMTGFLFGPVNPMINLVLQLRSPEALRGRVIGLVTSAGYAAGPAGYLLAGPLVEWLGLRPAFAIIVGAVVMAGFLSLFLRPLRQLDTLDAAASHPHEPHQPCPPGVPVVGGDVIDLRGDPTRWERARTR